MKKTFYVSIIFFLILSIGLLSFNGTKKQSFSSTLSEDSTQKTTPLFVVTGFSRNIETITLEEVKTAYCEGKIYVFEASKQFAEDFFGCKAQKTISTLQEFALLSKDNLMLIGIDHMSNQYKALKINGISFFGQAEQYPLVWQNGKKEAFDYKGKITKFSLTGVTAITRNLGFVADQYGTTFITEKIIQEFKDSDLLHISNEVSFMEGCTYVGSGTKFCTKKEHFQPLIDLGADIVELTGNHNRDHGNESFIQTYQWYKEQKMKTFGGGLTPEEANTPLIITLKDGKKIGFIGFNEYCPLQECAKLPNEPGANAYEKNKAYKVIQQMKNEMKVDFIFASVQFGEVDSYAPSATQAVITRDLVEAGADFVYGSQAHQIQQVEFHKGKAIFHGLGNFLFDQIHRIGVRQAFFLHHYFYDGKLIQTIPVFTMMGLNRQLGLANPAEIEEMKKVVYLDYMIYK
ncbi:MAG: hypothetical protein EAZ55_11560 [Cytophagales bacterium]|nr:MAG: hypothetical protein EAZ55_11560 [Cytophagales bacterium]